MLRKDIIIKLEELTKNHNFINVIARFILRDFCGTYDELYIRNAWNHFNHNEAAFIIGMWVKNANATINNIEDYDSALSKLYDIMEDIHNSFRIKFSDFSKGKTASEMMTNGNSFQEAFFYGAIAAYDFQYVNFAKDKYKYDDQWLIDNKGFSINDFKPFFDNIKKRLISKLNKSDIKLKTITNHSDILYPLTLSYKEIVNENESFKAMLSCFEIELDKGFNSNLDEIGDYNEFSSKPIIKLDSDKYFVPLPFSLSESIYESPFYWMNNDKSYSSKSSEHRGNTAEEITYKLFSKVFGAENVLKGIKIYKNASHTVTDIDIIIFHKNQAIIVQVKSKKLTTLSKKGNLDSIKKDFKKAVEDALSQGIISKECINNHQRYDFIDSSLTNINVRINDIRETYIICVGLDTFPALSHMTNTLLYENIEEPTICFSILDLEVICNYLHIPDRLFDYLTKRVTNCRYYYAENELCFLGFYLEHSLKPSKRYTGELIDNEYGAKIDRNYYPIFANNSNLENIYINKTIINNNQYRKIGRNEKCPCGSQKKNKDCHRYSWY